MSARDLPAGLANFQQPRVVIGDGVVCLMAAYPHGGIFLDLWGTYSDEDGYEVCDFSLSGDKDRISLVSMPGAGTNEQLRRIEDDLCRSHASRMAAAKADAAIERHLARTEFHA